MRQLVWNDELAVVAQRYLTDFPETEVVRSLCIKYPDWLILRLILKAI